MEPSELLARARSLASNPEDPLDTLSAAVALGMELSDDTDALIDLAVHDARQAGVSWSAIIERFRLVRHPTRRRFTSGLAARRLTIRRREQDATCSFCRRPPGLHVHMIHGERGRICDRCVALASAIVADLARRQRTNPPLRRRWSGALDRARHGRRERARQKPPGR